MTTQNWWFQCAYRWVGVSAIPCSAPYWKLQEILLKNCWRAVNPTISIEQLCLPMAMVLPKVNEKQITEHPSTQCLHGWFYWHVGSALTYKTATLYSCSSAWSPHNFPTKQTNWPQQQTHLWLAKNSSKVMAWRPQRKKSLGSSLIEQWQKEPKDQAKPLTDHIKRWFSLANSRNQWQTNAANDWYSEWMQATLPNYCNNCGIIKDMQYNDCMICLNSSTNKQWQIGKHYILQHDTQPHAQI